MCQMQWKGGRLLEANLMSKLPTRSSSIRKILQCLLKRKGNTWGETQEESVPTGSKKKCWNLHGRKQLHLCCTKVDTTNNDNKYRALVEKLIQLETTDWPKFQEHLKKTTLGRILLSTSSATGWEWREI